MVTSRLKELRLEEGSVIVELAVRAGVGPGTIVAIERHGHNPTLATKEKLARALGVGVRKIWPGDQSGSPTAG